MLYRKALQSYGHYGKFFQRFSTAQMVDVPNTNKLQNNAQKVSTVTKQQLSKEMCEHLKEIKLEHVIDFLPKKLLRRKVVVGNYVYLVNHNTAKTFCSLISKDLLKNTSYVIENNPGLGLLTKELLKAGVPFINLYEKNKDFFAASGPLATLMEKYKKRLQIKELNFADIWMLALRDNFHHENLTDSFLKDTPTYSWESKTYMQVILVAPTRNVLSLHLHNFFNQTNIFDHGRPTLYVAVHSIVWNRLTADNKIPANLRYYSQYNVFLNLFFDIKYFGELPRKSFIPWPTNRKKSKIDQLDIPLVVVKIEPKRQVFEILEKKDLKSFWHFLKYCMRTKKNKVINELEKFIPGCGSRLIESNIDICTTFKDLTPMELLELFKKFRSWPEYNESYFMPNISPEDTKNEDEEKPEGEENQSHESVTIDSQASL